MKFLVDAQLPYGIVLFLRDKGFDALHVHFAVLRGVGDRNGK